VWQWASETARHAVASTSQLLRRLDVSSLSLEDDAQAPSAPTKTSPTKTSSAKPSQTGAAATAKSAAPAPKTHGGFNPYDRPTIPRAAAGKKKPFAAPVRRRRSWWRRLFQRR